MSKKIVLTLTRMELLTMLLGLTHKHFAAMIATTQIDRTQMKGGKATAAKYGGHVMKTAAITFLESVDYEKAVRNKLEKFDLAPEKFLAEEHKYARRALHNGKLTSVAYHKDDVALPIADRRWYLVTYIMNGVVASKYAYTDANGNPVDAEVLHADLYDKSSKKQAEAGLTNIEEQVIYRNYSLNSIDKISFEGNEITLI